MDLSVNKVFKDYIKSAFNEHLALKLAERFLNEESMDLDISGQDLKANILKWSEKAYFKMFKEAKAVKRKYKMSNILTHLFQF